MNVLAWIGLAALAWLVIGVVVFCIREREARDAVGQFLLALVVGPALLTVGVFLRHHAPRAMRLSSSALERFAQQRIGRIERGRPMPQAWALTYRGRGLIVVRRAEGTDWLNDVPNLMSRCRREANRRDAHRNPS